jgi:integrase/recombinase XerD
MRSETNLSDNYRRAIILTLGLFSRFSNDKLFKSMTRSDVILFLQNILKPEDVDPLHKSIGTYNYYLVILTRFFKWLYLPNMSAKTRTKPAVVENIAQLIFVFTYPHKKESIQERIDRFFAKDFFIFIYVSISSIGKD